MAEELKDTGVAMNDEITERIHFVYQYLLCILKQPVNLNKITLSIRDVFRLIPINDRIWTFAEQIKTAPPVYCRIEWLAKKEGDVIAEVQKEVLKTCFADNHEVHRVISMIPGKVFESDAYNSVKMLLFLHLQHSDQGTAAITVEEMFQFYSECISLIKSSTMKAVAIPTKILPRRDDPIVAKNIDKILMEVQLLNQGLQLPPDLEDRFLNVLQIINSLSISHPSNIKSQIQKALNNDLLLLALICVNMKLTHPKKLSPRPIQILSVLLFIFKHPEKGRLLEIKTGEGKSLTIALLAAYTALKQKIQVDIVTSGDLLAKRDAHCFKTFFEALGLKCGHNVNFYSNFRHSLLDENVYTSCDVLYGTAYHFEGDQLCDFQFNTNIVKREKSYLIVDEVDNMLIDGKNMSVRLANIGEEAVISPLQNVKVYIWTELNYILLCNRDRLKIDNIDQIIKESTKKNLNNPENPFGLSLYHKELAELLIDRWVDNAIAALTTIKENVHYIVYKQNLIVIIDEITGEMKMNMRWQHGQHEFLELKHNLPMRSDGLTSVYYSNLKFFSEYKNICGLTGTLGSTHSKEFLSRVYNVDCLEVPTCYPSRFEQAPTLVVKEEDWGIIIVQRILEMISNGRPVLAIFDSIEDVEMIEAALKKDLTKPKQLNISKYIYSEDKNLEKVLENMTNNRVILATNLAGRGTDIEIPESIHLAGGLFVLLTFLPLTLRVQLQAFGRAARCGQNGSGQLIIKDSFHGITSSWMNEVYRNLQLDITIIDDAQWLIELRDIAEKINLEVYGMKLVKAQRLKDELFQRICTLIDTTPNLRKWPGKIEAVKERWAIFYARLELEKWNEQTQREQFALLLSDLEAKIHDNVDSKNPIHYFYDCDNYLSAENYNIEKAEIQLEKAKEYGGDLTGYHLRKAMICNNKEEYTLAKDHLIQAQESYTLRQIQLNQSLEVIKTSALTHRVNQLLSMPSSDLRRLASSPKRSEISSKGPSNLLALLDQRTFEELENDDGEDLQIPTVEEIKKLFPNTTGVNPTVMAQQKAARQEQAQLDEAVSIMATKIGRRRRIYASPNKQANHPFIPPLDRSQLPQPMFSSSSSTVVNGRVGYLGYILGIAEIAGGVCLCVFTGGIGIPFGIGLTIDGVLLIYSNYRMNRIGEYSNKDILVTFATNLVFTAAAGCIGAFACPLDFLPAIPGLPALLQTVISSEITHSILLHSLVKYFTHRRVVQMNRQNEADRSFGDFVAEESAAEIQRRERPAPESVEEAREQAQAETLRQTAHITQEKMNEITQQLSIAIDNQYQALVESLNENSRANFSYIAAVIEESEDGSEVYMQDIVDRIVSSFPSLETNIEVQHVATYAGNYSELSDPERFAEDFPYVIDSVDVIEGETRKKYSIQKSIEKELINQITAFNREKAELFQRSQQNPNDPTYLIAKRENEKKQRKYERLTTQLDKLIAHPTELNSLTLNIFNYFEANQNSVDKQRIKSLLMTTARRFCDPDCLNDFCEFCSKVLYQDWNETYLPRRMNFFGKLKDGLNPLFKQALLNYMHQNIA